MTNVDIVFVTAFKDIGRGQITEPFKRTNETYYTYFINMANHIKYPLIVYVEDYVREELLSICKFNDNIVFKDLNQVLDDGSFYRKYNDIHARIMNSDIYKLHIPSHRKMNPEHCFPAYNSIQFTKFNVVRHAKQAYPEYKLYAWIDFGCIRDDGSLAPRNIDFSRIPNNKITYHSFRKPPCRRHEYEMLGADDIYFDGSQFIVPSALVEEFERKVEAKLLKWFSINVTDDDQNLILQLYYDAPDFFHLVVHPTWFSLYRNLSLPPLTL